MEIHDNIKSRTVAFYGVGAACHRVRVGSKFFSQGLPWPCTEWLSGPFAEYKELHNLTDVFMINAVSRIHASESSFPSEHALLNDVLWLEALFPRDREISKLVTLLRKKYSTAEDVAAVFGQFAVREELSKVGFARLLG